MPHPPIDPAKLRAAALGRQTELYRYMLDHYALFARAIEKTAGKTDWKAIGAEVQAVGVKVGNGGKQGVSWAVRTTWAKVCADVAARNPKRRKEPPKAKDPAPGIVREFAPPVAAPDLPPPLLTTNRPAEKKYKFGLARFRTDEEQQAYDAQQRAEAEKQLAATRERLKQK
jgi:hypothetical protein